MNRQIKRSAKSSFLFLYFFHSTLFYTSVFVVTWHIPLMHFSTLIYVLDLWLQSVILTFDLWTQFKGKTQSPWWCNMCATSNLFQPTSLGIRIFGQFIGAYLRIWPWPLAQYWFFDIEHLSIFYWAISKYKSIKDAHLLYKMTTTSPWERSPVSQGYNIAMQSISITDY